MMQSEIVTIDGAQGEGGGQMLRSSLSLSMVTGRPCKITRIRAGRAKPGLLRQHLTAVKAAAEICDAKVIGGELGSQEVYFVPKKPKGGDYHFAIGTAGSTTLVAQTVIPALMLADQPSTLVLEGGTHNMQSPPFEFLKHSFLPILEKMGVGIEATLYSHGFYPAGGGKIAFNIKPVKELKPIELMKRGAPKSLSAEAWFANLSADIAKRELAAIGAAMEWSEDNLHIRQIMKASGSGNIVLLKLEHAELTETVASFGRLGVKAERVAEEACDEAKHYLASNAVVGAHLADQLLLPMALAGKGKFTTLSPTLHTQTNIEVIKKFLPCSIETEEQAENVWTITISRK